VGGIKSKEVKTGQTEGFGFLGFPKNVDNVTDAKDLQERRFDAT